MSRNYAKEYAKEQESKVFKAVKLDIDTAKKLEEKLKKDNTNFSEFVKLKVEEYLKK